MVDKIGSKNGHVEVIGLDNGFYLFRFSDSEMRDWVLDNGTWMFLGRPMVFQQWEPGFVFEKERITSIPI